MADLQQMKPGVSVRVTHPTTDHQEYLNRTGRIFDVRDVGVRRFCQVEFDDGTKVYFESVELDIR